MGVGVCRVWVARKGLAQYVDGLLPASDSAEQNPPLGKAPTLPQGDSLVAEGRALGTNHLRCGWAR